MNPAQIDFFIDQGYLRLEGFHPKNRMMPIRQKLVDELKRLSENKAVSRSMRGVPVFQQIGKLSALIKVPRLHEALVTSELMDVVTLLGGRMPAASQGTQLLLSPPHQGAWTLKGLNWHVDIAADTQDQLPGIQAFFLIDDVAPRGGGTLALAGSHRVGTRRTPPASSLRELLKTTESLERDLYALGITIVEMCGRTGDVILMDMRLLHTPSINTTKNVRMMATSRFFLDT